MSKVEMLNRKKQKVVVSVEETTQQRGLVFVMHGLGGFKEEPHIQTIGDSFKEKEITVVTFDTTNTFGESDGIYENATITNYYEDLEDIISWSKTQPWYQQPFYLAGHSIGGLSTTLYSEKYPEQIKGLSPISSLISGKLSADVLGKEYLTKWEREGVIEEASASLPDTKKRLKWSHMVDRLQHDVLPLADRLTMPVLLIIGDQDRLVPVQHQQEFYERLRGDRELHILNDAPHTFRELNHLSKMKEVFSRWIDKVEQH